MAQQPELNVGIFADPVLVTEERVLHWREFYVWQLSQYNTKKKPSETLLRMCEEHIAMCDLAVLNLRARRRRAESR